MEPRWNDDRRKPKSSEKSLYQRHTSHHKSHMDWPGSNLGLQITQAGPSFFLTRASNSFSVGQKGQETLPGIILKTNSKFRDL
jgi:hypothetical protein